MVSGTPSPRPASSAPSGRLYLLCGCRRALPLTGRIPSRRRCRCRCRRCRHEFPTPAPSGNPGNREHHPLPSLVRTQTRSPARARFPRLARPEPRPSLVGQRRRRRRDAWNCRANGAGKGVGRASGRGASGFLPVRGRLASGPRLVCTLRGWLCRVRGERPSFEKHQALAQRPLPLFSVDTRPVLLVWSRGWGYKKYGKGLGEGGTVTHEEA
ncbi:uncharacterized protein LOC113918821 [Zalophus californianus]|uniref:Uncharacterized protein LOC113918821 n=1 Tax=Zalophus californianus TaxID=9704 RepID=A0A6J2CIB6_ZALCA|nr:uncharacterized protein LOC113918821 [Zalophus californianus]